MKISYYLEFPYIKTVFPIPEELGNAYRREDIISFKDLKQIDCNLPYSSLFKEIFETIDDYVHDVDKLIDELSDREYIVIKRTVNVSSAIYIVCAPISDYIS